MSNILKNFVKKTFGNGYYFNYEDIYQRYDEFVINCKDFSNEYGWCSFYEAESIGICYGLEQLCNNDIKLSNWNIYDKQCELYATNNTKYFIKGEADIRTKRDGLITKILTIPPWETVAVTKCNINCCQNGKLMVHTCFNVNFLSNLLNRI